MLPLFAVSTGCLPVKSYGLSRSPVFGTVDRLPLPDTAVFCVMVEAFCEVEGALGELLGLMLEASVATRRHAECFR